MSPKRPVAILGSIVALAASLSPGATAEDGLRVGDEVTVVAADSGSEVRATPQVARGTSAYLAVWRDGWDGEGCAARVHAARLDDRGRVLDPEPFAVAPASEGFQDLPRVAFGGGVFLVVWQDFRNGRDLDVLGARITPEGKVLDERPIPIAVGPRTQSAPDVASDGTGFIAAWQLVAGEDNVYRIGSARISADGRLGAPAEIKSPWTRAGASPRLAWDGASFRVAFVSQSLLTGRLDADGSWPEKEPTVTLRGNLGAAIGFSHSLAAAPGVGMLAVYPRSQPDYWGWGGPGAMICSVVGADGKLDPTLPREDYPQARLANWLDFGSDKAEGSAWPHGACAVAWDGKRFVAVWQRHHIRKTVSFVDADLFASRVEGWRPLDVAGIQVAATGLEERNPALASDGTGRCLCVYERHEEDGRVALVARYLRTR